MAGQDAASPTDLARDYAANLVSYGEPFVHRDDADRAYMPDGPPDWYIRYSDRLREPLASLYHSNFLESQELKLREAFKHPIRAAELLKYYDPLELSCKGWWLNLCNKSTWIYDGMLLINAETRMFPKIFKMWTEVREEEEIYDSRFLAARIGIPSPPKIDGMKVMVERHLRLCDAVVKCILDARSREAEERFAEIVKYDFTQKLVNSMVHPSCRAAFVVADDISYETVLVALTGYGIDVDPKFLEFNKESIIEQYNPGLARMTVEHAMSFMRALDVEAQKYRPDLTMLCGIRHDLQRQDFQLAADVAIRRALLYGVYEPGSSTDVDDALENIIDEDLAAAEKAPYCKEVLVGINCHW